MWFITWLITLTGQMTAVEAKTIRDIPGLQVEVRPAAFTDVTEKMSSADLKSLAEAMAGNDALSAGQIAAREAGFPVLPRIRGYTDRAGKAFFGDAPGFPHPVYLSLGGRVFSGFEPAEEMKRFGWKDAGILSNIRVSSRGRVLYRLSGTNSEGKADYEGVILADIYGSTNTIIRFRSQFPFNADLSGDGSAFVLAFNDFGFGPKRESKKSRGTYVVDSGSLRIISLISEQLQDTLMSENGSELYGVSYHTSDDRMRLYRDFAVYRGRTGAKTHIVWPWTNETSFTKVASPDLRYIAVSVGMFPATRYVEGQWGIGIRSPFGYFLISSRKRSFLPRQLANDGTLHTARGEVFRIKNAAYILESGKGAAGGVDITRFP